MRVLIGLFFAISLCFANIGQITALVGDASIERNGKEIVAKLGAKVENKDIIKTQSNGKLQIIFKDDTIVTVGKNSALDIADYLYDEQNPKESKTSLNFFKGSFKTITGQIGKINKKRFKLKTKTASIGIRGTFIVGNQDMVACIDGAISVENNGVQVDVDANEFTQTQADKPPTPAQALNQENLQNLQNDINPQNEEDSNEDEETTDSNNSNNSNNTNEQQNDQETQEQENEATTTPTQEDVQEVVSNVDENTQEVTNQDNNEKVSEVVDDATQETVLNFEGKVSGNITFDSGDGSTPILEGDTNQVLLNFDIGGGKSNMTGSMKFTGVDVPTDSFNYTLSSDSANLNNTDFKVDLKHSNLNDTQTLTLKGDSNSVSTVSSTNIQGSNGLTADITFEATKK